MSSYETRSKTKTCAKTARTVVKRTPLSKNSQKTLPPSAGVKRKSSDDDEDPHKNKRPNEDLILERKFMISTYIIKNNVPMLSSLLEKFPMINMYLPDYSTPLTLAISQYPRSKEAFNFLVNSKSIDFMLKDGNGCSPLSVAIDTNNLEVIQCLLDKGVNIVVRNGYVDSLSRAVQHRKPDVIVLLLNAINNREPATIIESVVRLTFQLLFCEIRGAASMTTEIDMDMAFVRFDIPMMYKVYFNMMRRTREQRVVKILKPITQRRNVLTLAVEQQSRKFIKYLLSSDILDDVINELDQSNDTALSVALANKDLELAQQLLQKGASSNVERTSKNVLFNSIIDTNDIDAVKLLSGYNADVSTGGDHIPLTLAVKNNNTELVLHLLDIGANIHGTCWKGYSALTAAVHYSNLPIAEVLINRGADVNLCDARGRRPLNLAIEENKTEFVTFFVEKNAHINAADERGFTPLTQAVKVNNLDLIKLLCDKGCYPNEEDKNGHTPLTYAARLNHEEVVLYLINERRVDVNKQGWFGSTALLNVIDNENIKLAEVLISKGANVSSGDWKGRKPLVRAVERGNIRMIQLVLDNNNHIEEANISISWMQLNKMNSYSPISMAVALNKPEIVELLLRRHSTSNKTKIQALVKAIECGNIPLIKLLLKKGINPMELDGCGVSPLQRAIEKDGMELVDLLSQYGEMKPADIVTEACARNSFNILRHYLENIKVDVNVIDSKGYTPMTKCVENANLTLIQHLHVKKASMNRIDGNGFSPLTKALQKNNFDAVRVLVKRGADVSLSDGNNVKPLAKAAENDDMVLMKFLMNHHKNMEKPFKSKSECPVCYMSFKHTQPYVTTCGHICCKKCLNTVCKTSGLCPTCRTAVSSKSIHPLYI